jgi:hypothetical protein
MKLLVGSRLVLIVASADLDRGYAVAAAARCEIAHRHDILVC